MEIPADVADSICEESLLWHYHHLSDQPHSPPVFSYDKSAEQKKLKKLCKAFERVLSYYGTKV